MYLEYNNNKKIWRPQTTTAKKKNESRDTFPDFYQNLWEVIKAVPKWNFIAVSACIKKKK
jgi:hypothetical protein